MLSKCLGRGGSSASCRKIRFFIDATEDVYEVNVRIVFNTVHDVLETLKADCTLLGCLITDRSNYNHLLHVVDVEEDTDVYLKKLIVLLAFIFIITLCMRLYADYFLENHIIFQSSRIQNYIINQT